MKQPESFTLSTAEGEAIMARLSIYAPSRSDCEILMQVVRWYFWLVFALQETKITVKRLRHLLFGKSLKPSPTLEESSESSQAGGDETTSCDVLEADAGEGTTPAGEAPPAASPTPERVKPKGGHRPGTGRLGADAYVGAERVECRHEELAVGQRCPVCGQGNLYELPPGVEIRIDGHALLSALRYEIEKLRCSACGEIFNAELPDTAGERKYSASARSTVRCSAWPFGRAPFRAATESARIPNIHRTRAVLWSRIAMPISAERRPHPFN